ncbi:hypothetical protein FOL46_000792 [Perkinsus olseni]|uniref:Uncharacterized protein n=1 Tax=Perkinsus olseni TaxID=32597 RepID=A0A7J6KVR5_PEROL|nr:hypothetical protein FOL46_000792 [Perkinsus olseni]
MDGYLEELVAENRRIREAERRCRKRRRNQSSTELREPSAASRMYYRSASCRVGLFSSGERQHTPPHGTSRNCKISGTVNTIDSDADDDEDSGEEAEGTSDIDDRTPPRKAARGQVPRRSRKLRAAAPSTPSRSRGTAMDQPEYGGEESPEEAIGPARVRHRNPAWIMSPYRKWEVCLARGVMPRMLIT